ncbi:hypothetical protein [Acetobacter cibinongensis]|uniref:Uncharacterized protein n=1 Tax=Acetobacter cibinongensis TaxID=146475 RepID=A0A1Z5YU10_9PROT|nr:hypothetical protein [Acetobacter cibinongensis]OUJ01980.1 hypothetical protein HK14_07275 [Acetobacter cibinongensis]
MGYDVSISREPHPWLDAARPLLLFRPEVVRRIVEEDPELQFIPDKNNTGFGDILYLTGQDAQDVDCNQEGLWFKPDGLTAKYPSEALMKKMAQLAVKLNAHMVGDNDEHYFLDENDDLQSEDDPELGLCVIGDAGRRYQLTIDGLLKNLNELPEYLAENIESFSKEEREKFNIVHKKKDNSGRIYGLGATKCDAYAKAYDAKNNYIVSLFYTYYQGVVSAFNYLNDDKPKDIVYEKNDRPTFGQNLLFLLEYCRKCPEHSFISACMALISLQHDNQK